MRRAITALVAATSLALLAGAATAKDLAKGREDLAEIVLGSDASDYDVSVKDITLETGKSYRLMVTSKGAKEYKFMAPQFFRAIWFNQIVVNDLEIHGTGAPSHLEFDDAGTIAVDFVAIRAGEFDWFVDGLQEKGMVGKFIVK